MKFERVTCRTEQNYCNPSTCYLEFISRNTQRLTVVCLLSREFTGVMAYAKLFYRVRGMYHLFLLDVKEDVCAHFRKNRTANSVPKTFLEAFLPTVEPYSNWFHPCPFNGNITTIGTAFHNLSDLIPSIIPNGEYKVDLTLKDTKNVVAFELSVFLSVYTKAKHYLSKPKRNETKGHL